MATRVSNAQLVAFGLPAMVSAIMHGPITGIIPSLYATEFGLDLAIIGSVLLFARAFDAVTDPMIGFLSDRTESKYGKRKPWIVAGSILAIISIWFLFRPGETSSMTYLLVFSILLYLGWTIMEIPYSAWVLELSRDSKVRTRINAYRSGAILLGGILFTIMPALVASSGGSMNFAVLGVMAIIIAVAVPITTAVMVKMVPEGDVYDGEDKPTLKELWFSLKTSRPFQIFILLYLCIGLSGGIAGVTAFMYIDTYLKIGENYTGLFLPAVLIGPLTLPMWVWVLNKFGKHGSTAFAFLAYCLIMPMPWFIEPGPGAFIPMLVYFSALSFFYPLLMVSMPAILGDVVDYDELKTGKNRAAQFNSFLALTTKSMAAVGGPIALLLIGLFGYQPGAETNDETAILGLRIVFNLLPPLLVIPAIIMLFKFPITDEKQRQIRKALEARAARTSKLKEQLDPAALG